MHSYDEKGNPHHTVIGKNGKERDTWLRDVIENNWFPSVTEVNKAVLVNKGLQDWITNRFISYAYLNPPTPEESEQAFLSRVRTEGDSKEAMDFGTAMHNQVENYLMHGKDDVDIAVVDFWPNVKDWIDHHVKEVLAAELVRSCSTFGVGGTIDLVAKMEFDGEIFLCLGDWKTQKVKRKELKSGEKLYPVFYDDWIRQLALYSALYYLSLYDNCPALSKIIASGGAIEELPRCCSIIIDSVEPGLVEHRLWTREEQAWGLQSALANIRCWMLANKYQPKGFIL